MADWGLVRLHKRTMASSWVIEVGYPIEYLCGDHEACRIPEGQNHHTELVATPFQGQRSQYLHCYNSGFRAWGLGTFSLIWR